MSVIPEMRELYLWRDDLDGKPVCHGRIIGWSRWTSDMDNTDKYAPIVAAGMYGDGAHAQVIDTDGSDYFVATYHAGSVDGEAE